MHFFQTAGQIRTALGVVVLDHAQRVEQERTDAVRVMILGSDLYINLILREYLGLKMMDMVSITMSRPIV